MVYGVSSAPPARFEIAVVSTSGMSLVPVRVISKEFVAVAKLLSVAE